MSRVPFAVCSQPRNSATCSLLQGLPMGGRKMLKDGSPAKVVVQVRSVQVQVLITTATQAAVRLCTRRPMQLAPHDA